MRRAEDWKGVLSIIKYRGRVGISLAEQSSERVYFVYVSKGGNERQAVGQKTEELEG